MYNQIKSAQTAIQKDHSYSNSIGLTVSDLSTNCQMAKPQPSTSSDKTQNVWQLKYDQDNPVYKVEIEKDSGDQRDNVSLNKEKSEITLTRLSDDKDHDDDSNEEEKDENIEISEGTVETNSGLPVVQDVQLTVVPNDQTAKRTPKMPTTFQDKLPDTFEVTCKKLRALFHKSLFHSGSVGKCIEVGDQMLTPNEFEHRARSKAKKYKASIHYQGFPIQKLFEAGLLVDRKSNTKIYHDKYENKYPAIIVSNIDPLWSEDDSNEDEKDENTEETVESQDKLKRTRKRKIEKDFYYYEKNEGTEDVKEGELPKLLIPMLKMEKIQLTMCDLCGKTFYFISEMRKHKKTHKNSIEPSLKNAILPPSVEVDKIQTFTCEVCTKVFHDKEELSEHVVKNHFHLLEVPDVSSKKQKIETSKQKLSQQNEELSETRNQLEQTMETIKDLNEEIETTGERTTYDTLVHIVKKPVDEVLLKEINDTFDDLIFGSINKPLETTTQAKITDDSDDTCSTHTSTRSVILMQRQTQSYELNPFHESMSSQNENTPKSVILQRRPEGQEMPMDQDVVAAPYDQGINQEEVFMNDNVSQASSGEERLFIDESDPLES